MGINATALAVEVNSSSNTGPTDLMVQSVDDESNDECKQASQPGMLQLQVGFSGKQTETGSCRQDTYKRVPSGSTCVEGRGRKQDWVEEEAGL